MCADPVQKATASIELYAAWCELSKEELARLSSAPSSSVVRVLDAPGRPDQPELVDARLLPRRGMGSIAGRIGLIHSLAHIEFNAINLAIDAVYRFRGMPANYYEDWLKVASDEGEHFMLLHDRLLPLIP